MSNDYYFDPRVADAYDREHAGSGAGHDVVVDDIPFYVALARAAAALGQPVLELGCGTGRVTLPVAQAGAEAVGLDNAAPMLAKARRKAEALGLRNVSWLQADMTRFALAQRFGLVIIPFRSFQMLLSEAQQLACLSLAHEHLVPGGRLALNLLNPEPVLRASAMNALRSRPASVRPSSRQRGSRLRAAPALSDGGAAIARIERNLRLRYVSADELQRLLGLCGFTVEALYGWFDGRPFDAGSSEIVLIASKA